LHSVRPLQLTHAHADHPAVGVDHDGLLRARHKPSSMSRSTAIYDMSIWLKSTLLLGFYNAPLDIAHYVKRTADYGFILAEREHARDRHIRVRQRVHHAILALDGMG